MKLNPKEFDAQKQKDNRFHIFKDGIILNIPHNVKGFLTIEQAFEWLNDFIASYNRKFENTNIGLNEFCQFYLDIKKSQKEKLVDLLNEGILKSTDTYGNIVVSVSKLADYLTEKKVIVKHLL